MILENYLSVPDQVAGPVHPDPDLLPLFGSHLHCKKNCFGSGCLSGSSWIYIRIQLDQGIRLELDIYPAIAGIFSFFLPGITIMKSTKNYIVGNFLTIRLYPDFFPVITGCQSIGQRPGYDRTVRGRPALAGSSSGIFFTV